MEKGQWGRAFWVREIASAKALRWERTCLVQGIERKGERAGNEVGDKAEPRQEELRQVRFLA